MTMRARQKDRCETNPAFSTRRLKLGTFQTNLDSRLRDVGARRPARHHLGQHRGAGEARRRDGVRGAGSGGALAGLGRQDQSAGSGLRGLHLGRRHRGLRTQKVGVVSTSHITINHPIIAAKQSAAIDHISDGRFILNIVTGWVQPEIEMFGQPMLSPRGPLRLRRGMARHHQAAVDRGRVVRPRGALLQDQEGLSGAEADPVSLPRDHERRRLRARPPLRGEALRSGLHRDPHRRPGRMPRACAGLSQARARNLQPRHQGLDAGQHRAGRDREGGARFLQLLRPPAGRLGGGEEHGRDFLAGNQQAQRAAGADEAAAGGIHPGLGRLADRRHQGAGGRCADNAVERRRSTACWWRSRATRKACASSATRPIRCCSRRD